MTDTFLNSLMPQATVIEQPVTAHEACKTVMRIAHVCRTRHALTDELAKAATAAFELIERDPKNAGKYADAFKARAIGHAEMLHKSAAAEQFAPLLKTLNELDDEGDF